MDNLPVLKQLIQLLNWILVNLHDLFSGWGLSEDWTWGFAIIGLTIIVRLILFPLTWKQYSNAHALQAVQPKIRELQRKYKDDRNKLQAETMKLYQEHRVNPFASCLPLLLQLPVFIALYYAIKGTSYLDPVTTKALADAGFLWIKSVADGGGGLGMPDPTHILLILYVVTQLISTELMLQTQSDKAQKWLMRAMPIIFVFFLWSFPAGLFVYWVTTNLWTIGQQLIIRKAMKPFQMPAEDAKPAKRSRFIDALVSAQEKGDQARADKPQVKQGQRKQSGGQGTKSATSGQSAKTKPGAGGKSAGRKGSPGTKSAGTAKGSAAAKGRPPGKQGGGRQGARSRTAGGAPREESGSIPPVAVSGAEPTPAPPAEAPPDEVPSGPAPSSNTTADDTKPATPSAAEAGDVERETKESGPAAS